MPRPKRADEKNAIYHALNRGNGPSVIFQKDGDYEAFENILAEGLARYPCRILSYQFRRIKGDGGSFAVLITKTFWSLCSSSRHETLSGERIAKYNCVFAQSSSQRHLDVKLMFDNLVVFDRFFDLGAHR